MPEPKDLHVDAVLTNFSRMYPAADLIWPGVMPIVKVNKRSDVYYRYGKDELYRIPDDKIGPKDYANEVDYGTDTDNYSVKDHALEGWVAQADIDNADNPLDPMADETELIARLLGIAQEKRVADIAFSAANYPTGNKVTLSGTSQWGGSADDPINDIMTGLDTAFVRPNTIVFGTDSWRVFRTRPEVLDAVKSSSRYQGSPGGLATNDEVAALFEVDKILVGRGRINTAKEGQTGSYARLWGKHCALLHIVEKPTVHSVTFGATFVEMLMETVRGFDSRKGVKGSHFIKTSWNSDEKVIASDLGYFIENAVA